MEPRADVSRWGDGDTEYARPALPPRKALSSRSIIAQSHQTGDTTDEEDTLADRARDLSLETTQPPNYSEFPTIDDEIDLVRSPTSVSSDVSPSTAPSKWKTALEDARHFAGGLIHHPVESTKHYSILRHSHGIVYYKGPSTNVAITIFADRPLPPDRTLWVQKKGWSGKTGMKAKALLRSNSSWVNVTPSMKAEAAQLPPADERAWQRDIRKFLDKAPKELKSHSVRETDVLRIPTSVDDGYFRVVLCAEQGSKTVLCPSPVFRVASTSTSASSIKGASLMTLPMEIGIKVGSTMARTAAGTAIAPVTSAIQSQVSRYYQPNFAVQEITSVAYDATGEKIGKVTQQYDNASDMPYSSDDSTYDDLSRPSAIGPEDGPESPYPIRLSSKVIRGTGRSTTELGMPTANLAGVPDDILVRLSGIYFGWALVIPKSKHPAEVDTKEELLSQPYTRLENQQNLPVDEQQNVSNSPDWHEAIISVGPSPYTTPSITPKKIVKAYLLHDFHGASFLDAKISIVIMGYIRPFTLKSQPLTPTSPAQPLHPDTEALLYDIYKDIAVTSASLARPEWGAKNTLQRIKTDSSNRSVKERLVDARQVGQRHVNSIPLHKAGIRGPGAALRDRLVGQGGIYVLR